LTLSAKKQKTVSFSFFNPEKLQNPIRNQDFAVK